MFALVNGTWTYQQQLVPSVTLSSNSFFGISLALSNTGATALACGPGLTHYGQCFVFTETGAATNTWNCSAPLNPGPGADAAGYAAALSGDGTVALVGAPYSNASTGKAYVFKYSGGSWGAPVDISPPWLPSGMAFGATASLSKAGNVAAVGAPWYNGNTFAYVVSDNGSVWSAGPQIVPPGTAQSDSSWGSGIALSPDGSKLAVGGRDIGSYGLCYVFSE